MSSENKDKKTNNNQMKGEVIKAEGKVEMSKTDTKSSKDEKKKKEKINWLMYGLIFLFTLFTLFIIYKTYKYINRPRAFYMESSVLDTIPTSSMSDFSIAANL